MDDADRIWLSSESKPEDASSPAVATPTDEEPAGPQVDAFLHTSARSSLPIHGVDLTGSVARNPRPSFTAGLYCWRRYSSNPKAVAVYMSREGLHQQQSSDTADSPESSMAKLTAESRAFKLAGRTVLSGKPTAGLILFALDTPIRMDECRRVRFVFEETFGGDQVYVNRLHLYESTPDVVQLFVDDYKLIGKSSAGSVTAELAGEDDTGTKRSAGTPTTEAASLRLDNS